MRDPVRPTSPPLRCGVCKTLDVEWAFVGTTQDGSDAKKVVICRQCSAILIDEPGYVELSSQSLDLKTPWEPWIENGNHLRVARSPKPEFYMEEKQGD